MHNAFFYICSPWQLQIRFCGFEVDTTHPCTECAAFLYAHVHWLISYYLTLFLNVFYVCSNKLNGTWQGWNDWTQFDSSVEQTQNLSISGFLVIWYYWTSDPHPVQVEKCREFPIFNVLLIFFLLFSLLSRAEPHLPIFWNILNRIDMTLLPPCMESMDQ